VFEKWVARATRLCRSATRRPERARLPHAIGRPDWLAMRCPFRPASRRTAQASGLCYPERNFQTRSKESSTGAERAPVRRRPMTASCHPCSEPGCCVKGSLHAMTTMCATAPSCCAAGKRFRRIFEVWSSPFCRSYADLPDSECPFRPGVFRKVTRSQPVDGRCPAAGLSGIFLLCCRPWKFWICGHIRRQQMKLLHL